jgi:hypothetical protein
MFRTHLTVGVMKRTADLTETSSAVSTLVSTNYNHSQKFISTGQWSQIPVSLRNYNTHTQSIHFIHTNSNWQDCFSLMRYELAMSEIFRCIPDLPTLHRSILVLSLAGGRRHHGASCCSELRKIRLCLWDSVGRPRNGIVCFETYLVIATGRQSNAQTETWLAPVMTGFVYTVSSAITR